MSVTQSESGPQVAARSSSISGEGGIRTRGRVLPLHRFSKPALSATQPPLRRLPLSYLPRLPEQDRLAPFAACGIAFGGLLRTRSRKRQNQPSFARLSTE